MLQFTQAEIAHLREKARKQPAAVENMRQEVREEMEEPILVPKTGIGNWSLYYYCPKCSVKLEFNRHDPTRHHCPSCKRYLTGNPYDQSWWWIVSMRNSHAVFRMGLLYQIDRDQAYAEKAIAIMLEYAKYYKDYEVHGDIPYNGPGKVGAQTLDEANFQRDMAMAYDLLEEAMTEEESRTIREGLLIPAAGFLMEHRHMQLHNHEVIINSAIAIIGLICGLEDFVEAAVYGTYGLLYQLEHGMQDNHMWFEGAFGYHFYALTSFFAYEKFALHTPHSHIHHPNYKAMMELLAEYLEPGFRVPMLNDTNYGHTSSTYYLYEFAYRELGGEKLLYVLKQLYKNEARDNAEAFIYGVDELPECSWEISGNHVDHGCGNTIIRGMDGRYLLFKHDRYGGEHDHYDRLDISYLAYGKRISPDIGTTGYGALMHYDYYKNTATHNTVNIGGANQAPVNACLTRYEEKDGVIYMDAAADWTAPYQMPDSFTIVQWKEENYRSVRMERKLAWTDRYFADVFVVTGADPSLPVDWVMHVSGEAAEAPKGEPVAVFSEEKPYKHLHSMVQIDAGAKKEPLITVYTDGEATTHIFGMRNGQTVFCGKGPDNPSVSDINYRIERSFGDKIVFAHVITSSDGACKIGHVDFLQSEEGMTIAVTEADGAKKELEFAW